MEMLLDIDYLKDILSKHKDKRHNTGKAANVLPFVTTKGKSLNDDFNDLLGEFVRDICGFKFTETKKNKDVITFPEDPLISEVIKQINFQEETRVDLERFLKQHLYKQDDKMKIFHPYMYNYLRVPDKDLYKKYATFISDILVQDNDEIRSIFVNKNSDDILTELILKNLDLSKNDIEHSVRYQHLLPFLSKSYKEDLLYISNFKDYFLANFSLLTQFYSFMYVCQISLQFERFDKGIYNTASPLYFALEWESISNRRKASEEGFRSIKEKSSRLFVHIHTMSQLSHHKLVDDNESLSKLPFCTYKDLVDLYNSKDHDVQIRFLQDITHWILEYSKLYLPHQEAVINEPVDISSAFLTLFKCLEKGMNKEACENYGKKIENLGGKTLLKNRGSSGLVLNMKQEMLLLLTAVCVKNERMPLNKLFDEFTKRGVSFDRISRKVIVELFDSLNILDKKSDSGDAQYVKPIL
jgi:DNA phosphorothioation-dependent restriction protein DptG